MEIGHAIVNPAISAASRILWVIWFDARLIRFGGGQGRQGSPVAMEGLEKTAGFPPLLRRRGSHRLVELLLLAAALEDCVLLLGREHASDRTGPRNPQDPRVAP